ncbi:MAG: hypothetical protein OEW83_03090 [Acidimicrobiia bacterium]|nr:hypothetical protein [Acidimicrobiia bacterium]
MTDEPTEEDVDAVRPPSSDLSGPTTGWFQRARTIEAAAIAGVAYSLLTVVALIGLSRFPDIDLGQEGLTAWYDDDANQGWLIASLSLASIGSIAFLWFVAVIRRRLGDLEDRFFATVFLSSGIVYVAVWLIGAGALAAPAVAMTQLDAATVTPASASLAGGIGGSMILVVAPRLQAVFIFSTSTVILRSRVLPSWLAIVGYISGIVLFVVPLVAQPVGLMFPAWVFIVSVVLMLHRP